MAAHVLTDADKELIQDWLDWARRQSPTLTAGGPAPLGPAPEVYVAQAPAGGIPALTAGTGGAGDRPGTASCAVYRVLGTATAPELKAVYGLSRTVHNLATVAVPGNSYVPVARDKFGKWLAVQAGGGTGGGGGAFVFSGVQALLDAVSVPEDTYVQLPLTLSGGYDTAGYLNGNFLRITQSGYYEVGAEVYWEIGFPEDQQMLVSVMSSNLLEEFAAHTARNTPDLSPVQSCSRPFFFPGGALDLLVRGYHTGSAGFARQVTAGYFWVTRLTGAG
jgi:hypothetical protein